MIPDDPILADRHHVGLPVAIHVRERHGIADLSYMRVNLARLELRHIRRGHARPNQNQASGKIPRGKSAHQRTSGISKRISATKETKRIAFLQARDDADKSTDTIFDKGHRGIRGSADTPISAE